MKCKVPVVVSLFVLASVPILSNANQVYSANPNSKLIIMRHADDANSSRDINDGGRQRSIMAGRALAYYTQYHAINPIGTILYVAYKGDIGTIKPRQTAEYINSEVHHKHAYLLEKTYCHDFGVGCYAQHINLKATENWDQPKAVNDDIQEAFAADPDHSVLLVEVSHALRPEKPEDNIFNELTYKSEAPLSGFDNLHGHSAIWVMNYDKDHKHSGSLNDKAYGVFKFNDGKVKSVDSMSYWDNNIKDYWFQ